MNFSEEKSQKIKKIEEFSINLKKNILDMALTAGANSSHFGGALSISDLVSVLFSHQMNINKSDPKFNKRDRFILSKGHACLAYYAALSEIGYITKDTLKTFEQDNSDLTGHPVLNKELGIEFSNGSLGMGVSIGIGVALSSKKKNNLFNVYVIVGDGECNEGSVWEAAMAAPNFRLNNLYVIIDNNGFQQTGTNTEIMETGDLKKKWESFGWYCENVDGHNLNEICNFFDRSKKIEKPKALIAKTIKGKGFSFSENNNSWHHSVLTKSLYEKALKELYKK